MNIRNIIITLRYKIRYGSTVEWYNFWYIVLRKKRKIILQVASIDDTIRKIIDDRCSVSRFGDGEMLLTNSQKELYAPLQSNFPEEYTAILPSSLRRAAP